MKSIITTLYSRLLYLSFHYIDVLIVLLMLYTFHYTFILFSAAIDIFSATSTSFDITYFYYAFSLIRIAIIFSLILSTYHCNAY